MPKIRSPRGGLVIGGKFYRAGRFIPASELQAAKTDDKKRKVPKHNVSEIAKRLADHKRELDPRQMDFLRKVHDGLSNRYGKDAPHAIAHHADALAKSHASAHPDHHAGLSHHLGNAHALMEMAGAGGSGSGGPPAAASAIPGEQAVMGESTIKVVKSGAGFTATLGEASADGATAEEAVGKLVIQNQELAGIPDVQGVENERTRASGNQSGVGKNGA